MAVRARRSRQWVIVLVATLGVLVGCAGQDGSIGPSSSPPQSSVVASATMSTTAEVNTTSTETSTETSTVSSTETSTGAALDGLDLAAGNDQGRPAPGTVTDHLVDTPDGRRRHYRLYRPSALRPGIDVPLVIALHGGLGSSSQFAANSGFDELAESNGFVVAYPDGIGALPNGTGPQTWNGGYCCGPAARQGVDDVGFIRMLLDEVEARYPIDPRRVFVAGHSNGAIMAYRLACELSNRITAIAVQAGSLGVDDCRPDRPVSVFHLHGLADTNHPIDGGVGSGVAGVAFRSARDAVTTMADLDGCDATPSIATAPSNADVAVAAWTGCDDATAVVLVTVEGATHAWMGHAPASSAAVDFVGEPYMELDASRAIWSFLVAHPRP